ncbi:MAG: type II toxin-antitoxin system HicA family toxin [Nitrospinales bacterium]
MGNLGLKYKGKTSTVPFHKGKDLDRNFLKEICKQLGLDPDNVL